MCAAPLAIDPSHIETRTVLGQPSPGLPDPGRPDPGSPSRPPESLPAEVAALFAATDEPSRAEAWRRFLERYSLLLLHTAYAFGPGYDRAMDRYLYVLDQLRRDDCRRLRRFAATGRGKFTTWLVVVARRLCLDEHRRTYGRAGAPRPRSVAACDRRVVRRHLTDLSGPPADLEALPDTTGPAPDAALGRDDSSRALRAALATLGPEDRRLLRLRYEQNLSAREIAALTGFPSPFHVYRRLDRLLGALRRELEGAGIE